MRIHALHKTDECHLINTSEYKLIYKKINGFSPSKK
jgi:hypothetical protein